MHARCGRIIIRSVGAEVDDGENVAYNGNFDRDWRENQHVLGVPFTTSPTHASY